MKLIRRVAIGLAVVVTTSVAAGLVARRQVPTFGDEDDAEFSVVAAMDGAVFRARSRELIEARATAFMGGIELNLVDADLSPGAFLTLRAIMGGIDVVVPSHWRVEVMARTVMGGIGNLTAPDSVEDDAPVLMIDAFAAMGGIEIHAKEVSDGG
jgi:hypothetical protein